MGISELMNGLYYLDSNKFYSCADNSNKWLNVRNSSACKSFTLFVNIEPLNNTKDLIWHQRLGHPTICCFSFPRHLNYLIAMSVSNPNKPGFLFLPKALLFLIHLFKLGTWTFEVHLMHSKLDVLANDQKLCSPNQELILF